MIGVYGIAILSLLSLAFSFCSIYYALKVMEAVQILKSALNDLGHDFYGE